MHEHNYYSLGPNLFDFFLEQKKKLLFLKNGLSRGKERKKRKKERKKEKENNLVVSH